MKVLIIGFGSIAQKHMSVLYKLKPDCEAYALRSSHLSKDINGVKSLHSWKEVPDDIDFILITNPTSEHYYTIKKCLDFKAPLFIEKPPFKDLGGVEELIEEIEEKGIRTYTAFNFRFHPVIKWLKKNLVVEKVLEVQAYCGSFLPDWRPGRDYRKVYSAKKDLGGGVHLDLIHEMDYLIWLFGEPHSSNSLRSKVSKLEINSCDIACYWLQYKELIVSVILNYFRRDSKRCLEIVMEDDTWNADLIKSNITDASGKILYQADTSIGETYFRQMQYFLETLEKKESFMNQLSESTKTLKLSLQ